MGLPQFQIGSGLNGISTAFGLLQTGWAAILNPFITRPQNQSSLLADIALAVGSNTILHGLKGPLTGWSIVRISGGASIYDQQSTNSTPNKTLVLVSDAAVTVTLEVF